MLDMLAILLQRMQEEGKDLPLREEGPFSGEKGREGKESDGVGSHIQDEHGEHAGEYGGTHGSPQRRAEQEYHG